MHAKIEEMEKANLEPSMWTMQGEVIYNMFIHSLVSRTKQIFNFETVLVLNHQLMVKKPLEIFLQVNASSRPKNSALEVDLDFEHNVRPAPVITEEVTASLEEMIKKRIIEVCVLFPFSTWHNGQFCNLVNFVALCYLY